MKKILIIATIVVIGLVIVVMAVKKADTPTTLVTSSEQLTFTDEPGHYKTTILEADYSEHIITLETYPDGTARMFFDYKGTSPDGVVTREEDGSFVYNDDATQMIVTLDSHGPWNGEQTPYTPPSTFVFVKTATGVEATEWDKTRYDYNTLDFIPVPADEMNFYGDPTEA